LLPSLPKSFCLDVVVELEGGLTVPVAQVRGRHESLFLEEACEISPLVVTSLGIAEGSRLLQMIAHHPQVVFDPITGPEFGPARYWTQRLREVLVHPHGSGNGQTFQLDRRCHPSADDNPFRNNGVRSWFETEHVENTAAWCRASIGGTYRAVAASLGRSAASRFVELCVPGEDRLLLLSLFPGATEVVLVRDPRDLLCSGCRDGAGLALLAAKTRMLYADEKERPSSMLVDYEELVADTPKVMRTIFERAGLQVSAELIDSIVSPELHPGGKDPRREASTVKPVGGWRRDLPSPTIAAWARAFGSSPPALEGRVDATASGHKPSER
jgi:hypothetical protein